MTSLETLDKLRNNFHIDLYLFVSDKDYDLIEKELKALEIIKNTGILRPYETIGGKCWLETMCDAIKLTKENYDLLKEILR